MKNNKGFTLIELLAVITLIALLSLLIVPSIINVVNRNKSKLSEGTTQLIYSATELYLDANQTIYPKIKDAVYCPTLQEISDARFLEENVKDLDTNEKIDLSYVVESKYNGYKYEYEILETESACQENIISKDVSIAITSMTFYRDSVSEANKTEKLLKGYNYIIDVKVHTANISNGTSLDFVTKKYSEEINWGNGTTTVQDNKASFKISVPSTANLGEYVISVLNDDLQVTSNFKIIKDVETILKGNIPDLLNGNLTPVVYDESNKKWRVADPNDVWYDYSNQWWANAVILKDGVNKNIGDFITLDESVYEDSNNGDINAMYVWIPRYQYHIEGEYGRGGVSAATLGEIDIDFIPTSQTVASGSEFTYIHPAFWWDKDSDGNREDGEELAGIWVGKFETNNKYTLPNNSLAEGPGETVKTPKELFDIARQYETDYLSSPSEFDAHAMKNSEWAAVAYLSQSDYGKYGNDMYEGYYKNIFKNNQTPIPPYVQNQYPCYVIGICPHTTGASGGAPYAYDDYYTQVTDSEGNYVWTGHDVYRYDDIEDRGSGQGGAGSGASTTGNIYGVYDMAGGTLEIVMAVNTSEDYLEKGDFDDDSLESKYFDSYITDDCSTACSGGACNGHALNETSDWVTGHLSEYYNACKSLSSWFSRGGVYNTSSLSGIFYKSASYQGTSFIELWSFRSVMLRG